MNNFKAFFILVFLINCSKNIETNLPLKFSFDSEFKIVNTYGGSNEDIAHAIIKTYDGGFAVICNTKSNDIDLNFRTTNDSDVLFLKFKPDLELDYIKTYGGSDDDRGYDLIQLKDSGFILLGYSKSSYGLDNSYSFQNFNGKFKRLFKKFCQTLIYLKILMNSIIRKKIS